MTTIIGFTPSDPRARRPSSSPAPAPSLRDTIVQSVAHHQQQRAGNTTPHGVPIPENINILGRPPRGDMSEMSPEAIAFLANNFQANLRRAIAGGMDLETAAELATDVRQFRRAEEGDRHRPGEYMGTDALPSQPMPFALRETHRPDRLPGSPAHTAMRAALDDIDREHGIEALADQMGTHTQLETIHQRENAEPPSIRDCLEAAVEVCTDQRSE